MRAGMRDEMGGYRNMYEVQEKEGKNKYHEEVVRKVSNLLLAWRPYNLTSGRPACLVGVSAILTELN